MLDCKLNLKEEYANNQSMEVEVIIENNTENTLKFSEWLTPLEGFKSSFFTIRRKSSGKRLKYIGLQKKRPEPTSESYTSIKSHKSKSIFLNLNKAYHFSNEGFYTIQLDFYVVIWGQLYHCKSPKHQFYVNGNSSQKKAKSSLNRVLHENFKQEFDFSSSLGIRNMVNPQNTKDEHVVNNALTHAYDCLPMVISHLFKLSTDEYIKWFGKFNVSYWNKVFFTYVKIHFLLSENLLTLNLNGSDCEQGDFAYVFDSYEEIYLCDNFFKVDECGIDSQVGILIHELTHIVSKTGDKCYSQNHCLQLAESNPAHAISNADNYEYFFEEICCKSTN